MERNVILAGVGGQGILTIAHAISTTAVRRGLHVKQAEVHGMSQRGGAVYSHLRMADHELFSDLIPRGECDLILAMEPLEALRYVPYLRENGCILSNTSPVVNIPSYPPVDGVLERLQRSHEHVLIDADRLARSAGSALAANSVLVGAAAWHIEFDLDELQDVVAELLASKGERIVELNRQALRLGHAASAAYRDAVARGVTPRVLQQWASTVDAEGLLSESLPDVAAIAGLASGDTLPSPQEVAVRQVLATVSTDGRERLREHEVYRIVDLVGAISPPKHHFAAAGETLSAAILDEFLGERVVLKIVSPEVVHKSDVGAVVFARRTHEDVQREMRQLIQRQQASGVNVEGVLLVEFVEHDDAGFGKELFVGVRASREFGPVIAAGLGGIDTEYLARHMKPGIAAAKALAAETSAEEFLNLFRATAAYDILAGRARGHRRMVSDGELLRCFRAFIGLARAFCVDRGPGEPFLAELEVNPFAFVRQRLIPLDGRGFLGTPVRAAASRPQEKIAALLTPRAAALIGVSSQRVNFARIILRNMVDCGFSADHLYVIKPGTEMIDGVSCVPSVEALPESIDLLVAASAAESIPALLDEVVESGSVSSVILIPGGLGETEGSVELQDRLREIIRRGRTGSGGGPVVLGGNCLGVRSRPGKYDTFFIPEEKLDSRRSQPPTRTALVTQSGAFAITRLSNLTSINPAFAVTIGNQIDLTVSDAVRAVGERNDVGVVGVYVEGFNDLDGLAFLRAVDELSRAGKTVILYKAGRTAPGRSATAGHTASVAGDYDVCQAAAAAAGAIVVDTFKEFEQLVELATVFEGKRVGGKRIGAISNAGFETVGMADTIHGPRYQVEMATLGVEAVRRIRQALEQSQLSSLVAVRNPLDVNPMADERVYEEAILAMLDDPGVDAVVASVVPFTPQLRTTPSELRVDAGLARRLPELFRQADKPMVVVIDAGPPYDQLASMIRRAGVPVFPSCDQAIRSLGRYLDHCACRRADRSDAASSAGASPTREISLPLHVAASR